MQLGQINGVGDLLSNTILGKDRLWSIESSKLTGTDIFLFYARAGAENKIAAAKLIRQVQDHIVALGYRGEINNLPQVFLLHETPEEPFYVDEFVDGLEQLSEQAGLVTIFSLETKMQPSVASQLTWKQASRLEGLNQIGTEILHDAALRRHQRLPYVFWERLSLSIFAPVFEIDKKIEKSFGFGWVKLLHKYESMLLVSRKAEAEYFREII